MVNGTLETINQLWVRVQVSLKLHLDDPLDAIAVHCWNGAWGLISPGLFAAQDLIRVRISVIHRVLLWLIASIHFTGRGRLAACT